MITSPIFSKSMEDATPLQKPNRTLLIRTGLFFMLYWFCALDGICHTVRSYELRSQLWIICLAYADNQLSPGTRNPKRVTGYCLDLCYCNAVVGPCGETSFKTEAPVTEARSGIRWQKRKPIVQGFPECEDLVCRLSVKLPPV